MEILFKTNEHFLNGNITLTLATYAMSNRITSALNVANALSLTRMSNRGKASHIWKLSNEIKDR